MPNLIQDLINNEILELNSGVPEFIVNTSYLAFTGSRAYGVHKADSDYDTYGFVVPPIEKVFPSLLGQIPEFNPRVKNYQPLPNFNQYHKHGIFYDNQEYDLTIYNIIKYFSLCTEGNPNMVDSLFVPDDCILFQDDIGKLVRNNRHLFLHKGHYPKFKGYAYSQLSKLQGTEKTSPERRKDIDKYGYSLKFAYHLVRLLFEVEEILLEGTLTLGKGKDTLIDIRQGKWTKDEVESYFKQQEAYLDDCYEKSKLRECPDVNKIQGLLYNCFELAWGQDFSSKPLFIKNPLWG